VARFYRLVRLVIDLLVLRGRTDRSKDVEILLLRHQLAVLQRQISRARFEPVGAGNTSGHPEQGFRATRSERSRCPWTAARSLEARRGRPSLRSRMPRNGSLPQSPHQGTRGDGTNAPATYDSGGSRNSGKSSHDIDGLDKAAGQRSRRVFGTHRLRRDESRLGARSRAGDTRAREYPLSAVMIPVACVARW
jgi:hypothetical protein